eukprot:TRINITY_DN1176_c0_g1_i2.p1 TRINITY_DN1176_c0_g1~~TRINITY_DN1176_c0_g1_i2.p1  ORF type:complete len:444 (-),score=90.80 TRINITY_DN1176_c0_g1_i2:272-1603(-)
MIRLQSFDSLNFRATQWNKNVTQPRILTRGMLGGRLHKEIRTDPVATPLPNDTPISPLEMQFKQNMDAINDALGRRTRNMFGKVINTERFVEEVGSAGLVQASFNLAVGDPYGKTHGYNREWFQMRMVIEDYRAMRSNGMKPSIHSLVDAVQTTRKFVDDIEVHDIITSDGRKPVPMYGVEEDSVVPFNGLPIDPNRYLGRLLYPVSEKPPQFNPDSPMPRMEFFWSGLYRDWHRFMIDPERYRPNFFRYIHYRQKYHSQKANHTNFWYYNYAEKWKALRTEVFPQFIKALDEGNIDILRFLLPTDLLVQVKEKPQIFRNPRWDKAVKDVVMIGFRYRRMYFKKWTKEKLHFSRMRLRLRATKAIATKHAIGPDGMMRTEFDYWKKPITVEYTKVRFEYWPDGSMKIFAFEWNNTGYIKRRRVSPPFWISQPLSQRIFIQKIS